MLALNVFRSPLMICFASSSTELDYQRLPQCVSVHVVRMFLYVYVLLALALCGTHFVNPAFAKHLLSGVHIRYTSIKQISVHLIYLRIRYELIFEAVGN